MLDIRPRILAMAIATAGTVAIVSPGIAQKSSDLPTVTVVPVGDAKWTPLNPLRGNKGPQAATLWGNRAGPGPSGFLVRFVDGFRSPPHIHNVTYRGVVITGLVHNDDPRVDEMWMPTGSYWTQPKGAVHVTSAKGTTNVAYIEIADGPYLVRPVDKAFASAEKPINVDVSNLVWIDAPGTGDKSGRVKVAYLWGDPKDARPSGALLKLPEGQTGILSAAGESLRAVVIQGRVYRGSPGKGPGQRLMPGSYFASAGSGEHRIACAAGSTCIVYVRNEGSFRFLSIPGGK